MEIKFYKCDYNEIYSLIINECERYEENNDVNTKLIANIIEFFGIVDMNEEYWILWSDDMENNAILGLENTINSYYFTIDLYDEIFQVLSEVASKKSYYDWVESYGQ